MKQRELGAPGLMEEYSTKKRLKKTVSVVVLMAFACVSALSGCGKEERAARTEEDVQEIREDVSSDSAGQEAQPSDENTTNILIAYFSRADNVQQDSNLDATSSASINLKGEEYTGNMEIMAQYIQEEVGGDLFSVQTAELYSQNYRETTDQAKEEQNNDERPELVSHVENMEQYDVVFLGYPNWWGGLPMPMFTFLEEYDFSGKTIIPFCSHGGSALGSGPSEIQELCPDATLLEGLAVSGSQVEKSKSDIQSWAAGLSL